MVVAEMLLVGVKEVELVEKVKVVVLTVVMEVR